MLYPGSVTFSSPEFGQLRFDFEFEFTPNFNPNTTKGKFCIWNVKEVNGAEVRQNRVSVEKLQEMRAKLIAELDEAGSNLAINVRKATVDYKATVEAKSPSIELGNKLTFWQKARSNVYCMQCMVEGWNYDPVLWEKSVLTKLWQSVPTPTQFMED